MLIEFPNCELGSRNTAAIGLPASSRPSPQIHLQPLKHVVDDGADTAILDHLDEPRPELTLVEVGERPARVGTIAVDAAPLVVEKWAGGLSEDVRSSILAWSEILAYHFIPGKT